MRSKCVSMNIEAIKPTDRSSFAPAALFPASQSGENFLLNLNLISSEGGQ